MEKCQILQAHHGTSLWVEITLFSILPRRLHPQKSTFSPRIDSKCKSPMNVWKTKSPFAPGSHGLQGFRVWKSIRHSRNQASPKEGAWEIVGHWKISSYLNHPAGKRPHFEVGEPSPGREMEDYWNCISLRRMNSKFLRFPGGKTRYDVWLESATRTQALNCTCFGRWLKACNS